MGLLDSDDDTPRVRLAPAVAHQLHALRPDIHGFDAPRGVWGVINDQIAMLYRSELEAEALAFAAGYELGPPEFEMERGPNSYRMTATRRLRPRRDL